MKLKEIIFGNFIFESKQSIMNLGFPEVVASIFYEIFGKKAFLFAKWYEEYKNENRTERKNWWRSAHYSSTRYIGINDLLDLYNAAKISKEEYNKISEKMGFSASENFDQQQILSDLKNEIKEKLLDSAFFSYNNFVEAILKKEITDFKPYQNLTFQEASDKYESEKIFIDKEPLITYPDGWKWIDAGKKCHIIGNKMRNCGSTGVMSTDEDRTMLVLVDSNNQPHVVTTYSPNQNRLSGVEGGASTQIKPEYIPYVLDLIKNKNIELDIGHEKSKELKIRYLLGNKLKSIKRIPIKSTFDEYFLLTAKDGGKYYTNTYYLVPEEIIKKLKTALPKEIIKAKKLRTIKDFIMYSFGYYNQDDIREAIPGYEQINIQQF